MRKRSRRRLRPRPWRKCKDKYRAAARIFLHLRRPAMPEHDIASDRKAETGAFDA
jgi:hypothetical protein